MARSGNIARSIQLGQRRRDPLKAAVLSLVPGLGQLYNGQMTKGFLFMEAAALNLLLLSFMVLTEPIALGLREFSSAFHCVPNAEVMHTLQQMHLGSTVSDLLLLLIVLFCVYAARDAYDAAKTRTSKAIYSDSALGFPEATSGSYIFHFAAMLTLCLLTLFLLAPAPRPTQVTDIMFVDNPVATKQPKKAKLISQAPHEENAPARKNHTATAKETAGATRKAESAALTPAKPASHPAAVPPTSHSEAIAPAAPPLLRPHLNALSIAAQPRPPIVNPAPSQNLSQLRSPAPVPRNSPAANAIVPSPQAAVAPLPTPTAPQAQPLGHALAGGAPAPLPAPVSRQSSGAIGTAGQPAPVSATKWQEGEHGSAPTPANAPSNSNRPPSSAGDMPRPSRAASSGNPGAKNLIAVGPKLGTGNGLADSPAVGEGPTSSRSTGPTSKAIDFSKYMAELQRRIKRNWTPPRYPTSNRVQVSFHVSLTGELSALKLERSSGSATIDQAALKAVQEAAPFPPLPPGAQESELTDNGKVAIEFTFDYNVFGGGQGHFVNY